MNALAQILNEILARGQKSADDIINEANRKAAEILYDAKKKSEETKQKLDCAAEEERLELINRSVSMRKRLQSIAILQAKNEVIDEVIETAKQELIRNSGTDKRFSVTLQGDILTDNTVENIFDTYRQELRDTAYKALTAGENDEEQ